MCAEQSRGVTEEGVMFTTMEGEAKPKNLKISGGTWLTLIDRDVAQSVLHPCLQPRRGS